MDHTLLIPPNTRLSGARKYCSDAYLFDPLSSTFSAAFGPLEPFLSDSIGQGLFIRLTLLSRGECLSCFHGDSVVFWFSISLRLWDLCLIICFGACVVSLARSERFATFLSACGGDLRAFLNLLTALSRARPATHRGLASWFSQSIEMILSCRI